MIKDLGFLSILSKMLYLKKKTGFDLLQMQIFNVFYF